MSASFWVALVALLGWLVLVAGGFRAQRVERGKALRMALLWGAIFLIVTAVIAYSESGSAIP